MTTKKFYNEFKVLEITFEKGKKIISEKKPTKRGKVQLTADEYRTLTTIDDIQRGSLWYEPIKEKAKKKADEPKEIIKK